MQVPPELMYSEDHEWVRSEGDLIRIGITDYAQDALGDVVYIELPESGAALTAGSPICEVESTKSVSEIYAPVTGTVAEANTDLMEYPERLNEDPYGEGWICTIQVADPKELQDLMDAAAYTELTESDG